MKYISEIKKKLKKCIKSRSILICMLAAGILLSAAAVLLSARLIINAYFVSEYYNGVYHHEIEHDAAYLTPADNYILYYNMGDASFKNSEFKEAVLEYTKALSYDIPTGKECSVRVNLAMAKTKVIDFDSINQGYQDFADGKETDTDALITKINDAINELETARKILTEKGCADENDANGHSKAAEALKSDIDTEIKKLKEMLEKLKPQSGNSDRTENDQSSSQQDDSQNDDQVSDSHEKEIQQKMEEQQQEAQGERGETQRSYEDASGEYENSDNPFDGKTW